MTRRQPRAVRVVDVDIYRYLPDPNDSDDLDGWLAESGLHDEAVSCGHDSSERLAELVAQVVVDNVTRWADRYDITFVWMLEGIEEAMHQAAAAVGVTLSVYPSGA